MPTSSKPQLLTLQRGIAILEQLILSGDAPVRFGELKESLIGVQDSTLARLLKALEKFGYLERGREGYRITARVRSWGGFLREFPDTFDAVARAEIDRIALAAEESACLALWRAGRIEAVYSRSVENGIRILKAGETLHFEPDHAGALAVLSLLETGQRRHCLSGPLSRFRPEETFDTCLESASTDGAVLLDQSRTRPGVCRLARAFRHGDQLGSVFFCLTREACRHKQAHLSRLLQRACQRLEQ